MCVKKIHLVIGAPQGQEKQSNCVAPIQVSLPQRHQTCCLINLQVRTNINRSPYTHMKG
jgi:hypothetical protein